MPTVHQDGKPEYYIRDEKLPNKPSRSEMVQEIISRKPSFIERWALSIFMLFLLLFFVGTWFIKYPDITQANATLTAANAPKEIVIRQDGKLVKLFVGNDELVTQNQTIAWMESTSDHNEVIRLSTLLDSSLELL